MMTIHLKTGMNGDSFYSDDYKKKKDEFIQMIDDTGDLANFLNKNFS